MPDFVTSELKEKCIQFNVTVPPPTDGEASGSFESKRRHHHPHPPPVSSPAKVLWTTIAWTIPFQCFFSCIFNETGIYQNRNLDQDKLESYLQVVFKDSSDLQTAATQAFTTCATKVVEFEANLPARPAPSPPPGMPFCLAYRCTLNAVREWHWQHFRRRPDGHWTFTIVNHSSPFLNNPSWLKKKICGLFQSIWKAIANSWTQIDFKCLEIGVSEIENVVGLISYLVAERRITQISITAPSVILRSATR